MFQVIALLAGMILIGLGICGTIALVIENRQSQKDWPQDR